MLSSNQPHRSSPHTKPQQIWIFHDARPGHLSQLKGLAMRLTAHNNCNTHWFNVNHTKLNFQHLFYLPDSFKTYPKPDLILAAGHSTHLSLLIAGFKFKTFTAVLMKPSLPTCLFDAIICPKHDGLKDSRRVLNTFGPINKIDKTKLKDRAIKNKNLILIGGESKHFHFDSTDIIKQIKTICLENTDKHWILSNSPRTPEDMNTALDSLDLPNLHYYDYRTSEMEKIEEALLKAKNTWITPDSMSMIFEALTAESKVSLFDCKPKNHKRIVQQIEYLVNDGYISNTDNTKLNSPPNNMPWEAERAAIWLLNHLQPRNGFEP